MADSIHLRSAVPTFIAPNVAETARWYVTHLGFMLAGHFPAQEPYGYASLMRDAAEIMLLRGESVGFAGRPPSRDGWDAYVRLHGVKRLYEGLAGQEFVTMELTQQFYGDWEFGVRDPNGYTIIFGGD
jgi:catechol 2,3-dioxygenase-like lactoylglutathione lyase family enzyme